MTEFAWPTSNVGMLYPFASERAAREQADNFLYLARAAKSGMAYTVAKEGVPVSSHQLETRKALYQELGLLYVEARSDRLTLTPIGDQLLVAMEHAERVGPTEDARSRVDALLMWALANSQIARPQSPGTPKYPLELRKTCEIRPYLTFWWAIRNLDGHLTEDEFLRVLCKCRTVGEVSAGIAMIVASRAGEAALPERVALGTPGTTENHRIYWKSHASVADALLSMDDRQRFQVRPERRALLDAMLDFIRGCTAEGIEFLRARDWSTLVEYYAFAGAPCPPYLTMGTPTLVEIGAELPIHLSSAIAQVDGSFLVEGDATLCRLPINKPFILPGVPFMLRLASKSATEHGRVRLKLVRGRPIVRAGPGLGG